MFWDALSSKNKRVLNDAGRRQYFVDGDYVLHQGDEPDSIFVILAGRVKLTTINPDGQEILIELRGPGQLIGELGAVDGGSRSTAARAVGRTETLTIPSTRFREIMSGDPELPLAVLGCVVLRLRESVDRRLQSGTADVRSQLSGRLLELARDLPVADDGSVELGLPLTQQELGNWMGVSRDAVVLAFRRLREDGLVETGRRKVHILNPDALRQVAEGG